MFLYKQPQFEIAHLYHDDLAGIFTPSIIFSQFFFCVYIINFNKIDLCLTTNLSIKTHLN